MKNIVWTLFLVLIFGCQNISNRDLAKYVNPFIGTGGHGHTFPGATAPFGMVQLSPDTRKDNWDACAGYHYSDSVIIGFSHTHLSGTGVGDYGDIRIMPLCGELSFRPKTDGDDHVGYGSGFSHQKESASPGYYQVWLEEHNINVELTTTRRCGMHRYGIPREGEAHIVFDLFESVTSDEIVESGIDIMSDHEISGFRRTRGWAEDQVVYFYAVFSEPFSSYGIVENGLPETIQQKEGKNLQAFLSYPERNFDQLILKVGISAVSVDGAKKNLAEEIKGWDFDDIRRQARESWNTELGRIKVNSREENDKVKFYTALYHAFVCPNLFSDSDGSYWGHDRKIHNDTEHEMYTVFSLWDTYRALHPLMTLVQPEKTDHFVHTMLDIYDKRGLLPVWELAGNETYCMIGYHAVPVIADAIMKGYHGFDWQRAYEAMKHSSMQDHFGLNAYRTYGYIPADEEGESVSKTLEYAYDDWCIAMVAKQLNLEEDYQDYIIRAQYYKNLFDPQTGFIRGKRNSTFVEPFDPAEVNFMLTEANTWQYTFYVPQDINGFMELIGGTEAYSAKLDEMFTASSELAGREQSDITGLIGQYAHGNEPSHHMAYLYDYSGQPFKTQKLVRQIMSELYGTGPDGLCGNEDCGQMSAWLVMSALGFYPVTPASNIYAIGSPLFQEVTIELPEGKTFTVKARNNSPENIYIQSAALNGSPLTRSFLRHEEIAGGGELMLEMGPQPSYSWGAKVEDRPVSAIVDHLITPVPFYIAPGKTFRDTISVTLHNAIPGAEIYFRSGDEELESVSELYTGAISKTGTFQVSAVAVKDPMGTSIPANATFRKINHLWNAQVTHPYSSQYTAGGDMAVIDGETGGANFRTGGWQGYPGVDFEAIIDIGKKQAVRKITARFLDDQNAWIFLPVQVEIAVAGQPGAYKTIASFQEPAVSHAGAEIKEYVKEGLWINVRYVRITGKNVAICPEWHKGAGGKAWIFTDEVIIE
jgi:predicted alpha-1,2-mannosidase